MEKVIPPRLVEPYLTGRRSVIAGFIYRAQDCAFQDPAGFYHALALGYPGSEFSPDMADVVVLRWLALDMTDSLVPAPPSDPRVPASTIPEFYTLPVPVPVGTQMHRIAPGADQFIARYDGQMWMRPVRGE